MGIPPVVSGLPVVGPAVEAIDNLFSTKERQLKNFLEKNHVITREQRDKLDDGHLDPGTYMPGDRGIAQKLLHMGMPIATVEQLAQRFGIPPHEIGLDSVRPLAEGEVPALGQANLSQLGA